MLSIFIVHYSLNKIKLAFGAQYKIVILTYLLSDLGLEDHWLGLGFEDHSPWP